VPKVSVTVITKNEGGNIAAALESVRWADEVIVVDAESTDDTTAIARRFTDRVFVRAWAGYGDQKNFAASQASHDWILSLDADERVTPALADEVRAALATDPPCQAYRVPRVTWHFGRWIRSTDWYPDHQLRLYDRRSGRWAGDRVHEALSVQGAIARLHAELRHFPYRNLGDHLETIDRYTTSAARQMHEGGRRSGLLQLAAYPPLAFLRNYVARGGFRDGTAGLVVSVLNSYYVFLKYAKLWELQRTPHAEPSTSHAARSTPHAEPSTSHEARSTSHEERRT
jgi:glycosyltransferase involved in cell wall biosynthesis